MLKLLEQIADGFAAAEQAAIACPRASRAAGVRRVPNGECLASVDVGSE